MATMTSLAATCALVVAIPAQAETLTFVPTGAEQTAVVPAGVTSMHVIAIGGRGGIGQDGTGPGGFGAIVTADLPVSPGQTLYVSVGGNGAPGASGGAGGFNGGGPGGQGNISGDAGGGGGGASDIRTAPRAAGTSLTQRLIVAAGGGGGGGHTPAGGGTNPGGTAGAKPTAGDGGFGNGGQPGSATAGGKGADEYCDFSTDGALGFGGPGSNFQCVGLPSGGAGGGGGGGIYGGGGGGASSIGSGGGAGWSGVAPGATNVSVATDITALPSVQITWGAAAPPSPAAGMGTTAGPPASTPAVVRTCRVPRLSGRKLKGVRTAVNGNECKLGKVRGKKSKVAKVVGQSPKPGTLVPVGTEVNVTLGAPRN